jgi:uncharacterized protein with HEPN domain
MNDHKYLLRIVTYCEKIMTYMETVKSFTEFNNNNEKVDAVSLNLEQLGETAKKLSDSLKQQHSAIEWPKIIGLRNVISHDYEGIKRDIIYDIATSQIPTLLHTIKHLML